MVMSSERRLQEERENRKKEDKSVGDKNNSYTKPLILGVLALAAGAGIYFSGYAPQHKKYIKEHKIRIESQEQNKDLKENSVNLAHQLLDADSTVKYFMDKSEKSSKEVYALRGKITLIEEKSDSTIYALSSGIASLSDSLNKKQDQIDKSNTYVSLLEQKLTEANTKVTSLADSTKNLYNLTVKQSSQLAEKDQRITELTPDMISIANGTTIEAYSQSSTSNKQNGYGFGITTRLLNGRSSGIGGLVDVTFSSDKQKVDKSIGPFFYLKDSKSKFNLEFGGGYNFESDIHAETINNPYFLGAVKFDLFGVRGASIKLSSKSIKGQDPIYRVGTSFGIR